MALEDKTAEKVAIDPEKLPQSRLATSREVAAPFLGILIVMAFAAYIVFMLGNLDLSEVEWARALFLFAGVEAVAFAAVGYYFGTQAQRARVQEAKAESQVAKVVADRANEGKDSERRVAIMLAQGILAASAGSAKEPDGNNQGTTPLSDLVVAQARALLRDQTTG